MWRPTEFPCFTLLITYLPRFCHCLFLARPAFLGAPWASNVPMLQFFITASLGEFSSLVPRKERLTAVVSCGDGNHTGVIRVDLSWVITIISVAVSARFLCCQKFFYRAAPCELVVTTCAVSKNYASLGISRLAESASCFFEKSVLDRFSALIHTMGHSNDSRRSR